VYIAGLILGYGPVILFLFFRLDRYIKLEHMIGYIVCFFFFPTIIMAVVYCKIGRTLIKQNKYIKSVCSNPAVRRSAPSSSFNILTFFRNRKTFFVCLFTVLCYGFANILFTVCSILDITDKFRLKIDLFDMWAYWDKLLKVACWHSANPLIYGILDKKLIKFWKRRDTTKRKSPEH